MNARRPHPATLAAVLAYVVLAITMLLEKAGRTTQDTRLELTEAPAEFLLGTFSLWNAEVQLGELRNQAYGYLFPQGPWFVVIDWLGVAPWVSQRLWSLLLVVAACEGCRRLAGATGLGPWPAVVAGLAYGLSVRIVAQVGVRSAEVLPTVVLPWVALPVVLCLTGRLAPRRAAVLSAAAYAFSGAANATASVAVLPLVVILLVWGAHTARCRWTFPAMWAGLVGLVSAWWVFALLVFGRYSPPFFDYVEDARAVTHMTGASASLRGASNWVNVIEVGGSRWWPAGYELTTTPWLVAVTALVAALGLLGLACWRSPMRTPLAWSALVGLVCLTVAHVAQLDAPLSLFVRDLLDTSLAPLRNVHKVDPILRLPLALGLGAAVAGAAAWLARRGRTRAGASALTGCLAALLVLSTAQPVLAGNLRTPGWREIPEYWQQAADYVDARPGEGQTWVLPGSGFALQTWGWTMEEPIQVVTDEKWVARTQVPLSPASTIRMLGTLEAVIETGFGSPRLGDVLARLGIDHVVVRHDLDPATAEATSSPVVSAALSRSNGVRRVATFGSVGLGPAIEVYEVTVRPHPDVQIRDTADAVTVSAAVDDVIAALGQGLVARARVALVRGDSGWSAPADVIGDRFRLRERNFGRIHDAYGGVLTRDADLALNRIVADYPGPDGAQKVHARYFGIEDVSASSSRADADSVGPTHPESAPFAAIDGDPTTAWRAGLFADPEEQWWRVDFGRPVRLTDVRLDSRLFDAAIIPLEEVEFVAGDVRRQARVDDRGVAAVDLGGVRADHLLIRVLEVAEHPGFRAVAIDEIDIAGVDPQRTLVVPEVEAEPDADFLLTADAETRACRSTLLGPECSLFRHRTTPETFAIDRTITVPEDGTWEVLGNVAARSRPESMALLQPLSGPVLLGSSVYGNDPTVSYRMAHDGEATTSWLAGHTDGEPTLRVTWPEARTVDRIRVEPPAPPAVAPTSAVIDNGTEQREVDLTGFGTFAPIRGKELTLTFRHDHRAGRPLGIAELHLSRGSVTNPLAGGNPTGAFCGFGPRIVVDGTTYDTRVEGFMGDVVSAGPLALTSCSGPIDLSEGTHRIRVLSTPQFQPTDLLLARGLPPPVEPSRTVDVVSRAETRSVVEVSPGLEAVLSVPWNFNEGWRATVDGRVLEPQRVDGWAQGWIVPAGSSGRVVLEFVPQRLYLAGLVTGLVIAAGVLLWAALLLVRRPIAPPAPRSSRAHAAARTSSRRLRWPTAAVLLPATYLLGGVAGLAAGAWTLLARRTRWWWVLPGLLLAAGVVTAGLAAEGPAIMPVHVDLLTGAGAFMVLVRLVTHPVWPLPDGDPDP